MPEKLCAPASNPEAETPTSAAAAIISRRTADCMVANLPWGGNAFQYYNENSKLIAALGIDLKAGCECAFVVQEGSSACNAEELLAVLRENGFEVSDTVQVGEGGASSKQSSGGTRNGTKGQDKVLDRGRKQRDDGYGSGGGYEDDSYSIRKGLVVIFAHRTLWN